MNTVAVDETDGRISKIENVLERLTTVLESIERDVHELKTDIKAKLPMIDRLADRLEVTTARVSKIETGLLAVIWVVIVAVLGAVLTMVMGK